jgi:hypothetical protein
MPTVSSNGTLPRTPREWQAVFRDWEASGLTQVQFCTQHGLSIHVFRAERYGKRRSRAIPETGPSGPATFVPVKVVAKRKGSAVALLRPTASVIELVLVGGRVVRVPTGFDEHLLARVIAVVEGRTC